MSDTALDFLGDADLVLKDAQDCLTSQFSDRWTHYHLPRVEGVVADLVEVCRPYDFSVPPLKVEVYGHFRHVTQLLARNQPLDERSEDERRCRLASLTRSGRILLSFVQNLHHRDQQRPPALRGLSRSQPEGG